jgi:tyrosinase
MASTTPAHHNHIFYDWAARIRVKQELDSSFVVLIFLGEVPNDPADWILSPTYVGSHDIFLNSSREHCANCRARANTVIEGFVHLSPSIARLAPHLRSYDPSVVGPYLKENLHWRVRKVCILLPVLSNGDRF